MHVPVLMREVLAALNPQPGQWFIDCTVGGGGHAQAILEATAPDGRLLGLDADPYALEVAYQRLQLYGDRAELVGRERGATAEQKEKSGGETRPHRPAQPSAKKAPSSCTKRRSA